ncbi:MAG: thioredoxin family protein [Clostridia bacterium]|jgi:glutaredoxin
MKEITYFYLQGCPYCKQADRLIEELCKEDPKYLKIKINRIEERENRAYSNSFDYFYVPCLWIEKKKIHEGPATKESIKKALESALEN